jgi:hypothetical protein
LYIVQYISESHKTQSAATQSLMPLDAPLAPQSKSPFTCLPSAERGKNHMVQDQKTLEVEKHPSTTYSKLLVHKQWVTYQGTSMQNTKFLKAKILGCFQ